MMLRVEVWLATNDETVPAYLLGFSGDKAIVVEPCGGRLIEVDPINVVVPPEELP